MRAAGGTAPGLFWLGGFKADMRGIKAQALARWAAKHGRACTRFDYSGHGESGGAFTDGTIGKWLEESRAVFTAFAQGPQVLIGSSMGGWLALLLMRELNRRADMLKAAPLPPGTASHFALAQDSAGQCPAPVAGLVLIAPAVDFTEELMWKRLPPEAKRALAEQGVWARPSAYSDEPYPITRRLIEEAREHLLLGGLIETGCPVRILQGVKDEDVPWRHAVGLCAAGPRRRSAYARQGWRSPPVAVRGHRAPDRGSGGVLIATDHMVAGLVQGAQAFAIGRVAQRDAERGLEPVVSYPRAP